MRPIVGIISNHYLINDQYPAHANGSMNTNAVSHVSRAVPLTFPADPAVIEIEELLEVFDGFLFTGGRPNVHPEEYGEAETEAHGTFDRDRDRIALPLIRAAVDRGQPILGICRGFQEVAVAFGSTLHPEIRDLPGRDNHRMPPDGTLEEKFALRHPVTFTDAGPFARLMGNRVVQTNTLHGQGIETAGPRVRIDGTAPDGTELYRFAGRSCRRRQTETDAALGLVFRPTWPGDPRDGQRDLRIGPGQRAARHFDRHFF